MTLYVLISIDKGNSEAEVMTVYDNKRSAFIEMYLEFLEDETVKLKLWKMELNDCDGERSVFEPEIIKRKIGNFECIKEKLLLDLRNGNDTLLNEIFPTHTFFECAR